MSHLLAGLAWLAAYLALVLAPLFVLLLGDGPAGAGFWWDAGIALGFAGLTMMMVQFVLTARFKRATAPYGIDVIYFFHRYLAVVALLVAAAHPTILIAINPVFVSYLDPFEAPWHMTAGVVSLILLVALVATSLWRKPLGLEYDRWRLVHAALAIVAVVGAVLHVAGVNYYVAEPWKRGFGLLLIGAWAAVVAHVRLVRPWGIARRPYRVSAVHPERGDAWTVSVEPVGHEGFQFQPGQFSWLTLRHSPFAMQEHPFSMSSIPSPGGHLEFTIKALGDFTRTVGTVQPGETAYVDGPYGAFCMDRHPAPGYVFIGGGIGLAPLVSMVRSLAARRDERPHVLVSGHSTWDRIPFREELARLASDLRLHVAHILETPPAEWTGERGYIDRDVLDRHLPANRRQLHYFVCGPEPMIVAVERALHAIGVPLASVHVELFDLV